MQYEVEMAIKSQIVIGLLWWSHFSKTPSEEIYDSLWESSYAMLTSPFTFKLINTLKEPQEISDHNVT